MYQLDSPYYLYLLIIIPILLMINIIYMVWRKKTQENFSSRELLEKLSPNRQIRLMETRLKLLINLKMLFEILAIFLLIIALVNPKIGTELKTVKREGVDIVFALDISKSMLAEDVAPNRLQKSKRLISEIIYSLGSDRVGVLVYADLAVPQVPLATDFASVMPTLLSSLIDFDISVFPSGGSIRVKPQKAVFSLNLFIINILSYEPINFFRIIHNARFQ